MGIMDPVKQTRRVVLFSIASLGEKFSENFKYQLRHYSHDFKKVCALRPMEKSFFTINFNRTFYRYENRIFERY